MTFKLVNPHIDGNLIESSEKRTSDAANEIWSHLSSNIKNYTPKFLFTIQKGGSAKLYHYKVNEKLENNKVSYIIENYTKNKATIDKLLLNELANLKQKGGKHKKKYDIKDKSDSSDSSSSSSSSSSDEYIKFKNRQSYADNVLLTYYPSIYGIRNILLPTFSTSFVPYVRINLPLYNNVIVIP